MQKCYNVSLLYDKETYIAFLVPVFEHDGECTVGV